MPRLELKTIRVPEDFEKIRIESEKFVAHSLLLANPNLEITYEPRNYTVDSKVRKKEKLKKTRTLPDFEIRNPESGESFLLEVTEAKHPGTKNKQRKVVEHSAPGTTFIVFCRDDIKALQSFGDSPSIDCYMSSDRPSVRNVGELIRPLSTFYAAD